LDVIEDQFHRGYQLRRNLVRLENDRRKKQQELRQKTYPRLIELEEALIPIEKEILAIEGGIKVAQNSETLIKLKAARKPFLDEKSKLEVDLSLNLVFQGAAGIIDNASDVLKNNACSESGLYPANIQQVIQTVKRTGLAPIIEPEYTGEGKIAVYLPEGLSPAALFAGQNRLIRVDPVPATAYGPRQPHEIVGPTIPNPRRTKAFLRVGRTDAEAVWAEIPVLLHRPFPEDCAIRQVWLSRKKSGYKSEWKLQFTCWHNLTRKRADKGVVGIDLGWRKLPTGLRVAYWAGDDGQAGEIVIPNARIHQLDLADNIDSERIEICAEETLNLKNWISNHAVPNWLTVDSVPETLKGLFDMVSAWMSNRFAGDEAIFDQLMAWRKEEMKLANWAANQRKNFQNWRKQFFLDHVSDSRAVGAFAKLAQRYRTAVVEDNRHTPPRLKVQDRGFSEKERVQYRNIAGVGLFSDILRDRLIVKAVQVQNAAVMCHECHRICKWEQVELKHKCEHPGCRAEWDQDYNTSRNLLAIGLEEEDRAE
jgi:hypothetical protein